jgi:hypothetical protein
LTPKPAPTDAPTPHTAHASAAHTDEYADAVDADAGANRSAYLSVGGHGPAGRLGKNRPESVQR